MRNLPRFLSLLSMIMALLASDAHTARSEELPLFISSFAAGDEGGIQAATLDLTTRLLKLGHRTTGVENPFFLALSPNRKFLYSIHAKNFGGKEPEQVAAYAVVGNAGELKLLNRQSTHGTASCYLEVDASGKSLLVANYATGNVAALPIQADGSLSEAASIIRHVGRSVDPDRQNGAFAHCIVRSPDNRFALAADLGIDQILIYALDSTTARLTPHRQPFVRTIPGSGPRHLTFHPNGKHVYVINELSNSVTMFRYMADPGILIERETRPTVPMLGKDEKSYCADLKITPN
ncbi:MAG: lactonase family protein, partial [Planctomycetota bacterium]|nr:lactonase family protein [Planctomycetota bacterium]